MQVLLAQSVPSASAVPCLTDDVPDWLVTVFDVGDGRARIEFTDMYGRDDDTAVVELAAECDVGDAREVTSRFDGIRRYDRQVDRANGYADRTWYVYPGACVALRFNLAGAGAVLRGGEIAGALGFVSRADIDRQVRAASDGHLRLDA
jgi:hypothetical protein